MPSGEGGNRSTYTGAAALPGGLKEAEWLLADRGYDADWFRYALRDQGIMQCTPCRKSRGKSVKQENRTKIIFGQLKEWRHVATGYGSRPSVFLTGIAFAATVNFRFCDENKSGPKAP